MNSRDDWCTIESDPGVFTSLVESFGVKNVELSELWSLDDDALVALTSPMEGIANISVHGLIFLFKWQSSDTSGSNGTEEPSTGGQGTPLTGGNVPDDLFFAKQVTHNACATQAILSVLFNAPNSITTTEGSETKIEDDGEGKRLVLGPMLSSFKSFTQHFPPDLRGEAIGSSEEIRAAHNSFGRADDAFLSDPTKEKRVATEDDDVFHFIAYVPHQSDGCVYELDGLKEGPIRIGSYRGNESDDGNSGLAWIRVARDAIQSRLSRYPSSEIKFNLMAVVQDRRTYLAQRLDALISTGIEESDPSMLTIRSELAAEEEKRAQWAIENERRRHNYLPFCIELLRSLAGSGKFDTLVEMAKQTSNERRKHAEALKLKSK